MSGHGPQTCLVSLTALFLVAHAAAPVAADEKTTVWSGALVLDRKYEVPEGYTLRIDPGTIVQIAPDGKAGLTIQGTLDARGTKDKPIRFESAPNGYWDGIVFSGQKASGTLRHCNIVGRGACLTCKGSSPTVEQCTVAIDGHSAAPIVCTDGAAPAIRGNTIVSNATGGGQTGILCVGSAPTVADNLFKNVTVGVQVCGLPADAARPRITGSRLEGGLLEVFDQDAETPQRWQRVYESELVTRAIDANVQTDGRRQAVRFWCSAAGDGKITEFNTVSERGGEILLQREVLVAPLVREGLTSDVRGRFTGPDRVEYELIVLRSGGSLIGTEGCMDTPASYALLLAGKKERTLAWRSPLFARGALCCTAADLDGDGRMELVVAAGRWCEGKGTISVFRQAVGPVPTSAPAKDKPSAAAAPAAEAAAKAQAEAQ